MTPDEKEFVAIISKMSPAERLCALAAIAQLVGETEDRTYPKAVIKKAVRMCRVTLGNPRANADDREHAEHAIAYIRAHVKPE